MASYEVDYGGGGVVAPEYLIKNGILQNGITFTASNVKASGWGGTAHAPTVTQGTGYIELVQGSSQQGSWHSDIKVDLTNYNTVIVKYEKTQSNNAMCIEFVDSYSSFSGTNYFPTEASTSTGSFFDISSIEGSKYILIGCNATNDFKIKDIILINL